MHIDEPHTDESPLLLLHHSTILFPVPHSALNTTSHHTTKHSKTTIITYQHDRILFNTMSFPLYLWDEIRLANTPQKHLCPLDLLASLDTHPLCEVESQSSPTLPVVCLQWQWRDKCTPQFVSLFRPLSPERGPSVLASSVAAAI
jgi:hypothetical protein